MYLVLTKPQEQIRQEKNVLQREYHKWQSLPEKIGMFLPQLSPRATANRVLESEERAKALHEQAMRDARKNVTQLQYDWDAAVVRRAEIALRYKKSIEQIREAHHALLEAEI